MKTFSTGQPIARIGDVVIAYANLVNSRLFLENLDHLDRHSQVLKPIEQASAGRTRLPNKFRKASHSEVHPKIICEIISFT